MNQSLNRLAFSATLHCLIGCGIGEVLGMVLSTAWGWAAAPSVILAVVLAFIFGYAFSLVPLLKHKVSFRRSLKLALAADTISITIMEITDNAFILAVPGAIDASLSSWLFWSSLGLALLAAFVVAYPANRYLIARGQGHAVLHDYHD